MTRAPREAPPPSRWGRSRPSGTYFEVTGGRKRNAAGRKLYRLRYFDPEIRGTQEWTLEELLASCPRWLQNKPNRARRLKT